MVRVGRKEHKTETERERSRRASARHLQDSQTRPRKPAARRRGETHGEPGAALGRAGLLELHLPWRPLRGVDVMNLKPRKSKKTAAAQDEKLDATPERLARAEEAGQETEKAPGRARRLLDPFDVMRATRALAPHDPKLNDIRWLIGEALRRVHGRAGLEGLRAVALDRIGTTGFGPRSGLPMSEIALHARDKLRAAEEKVGPAAWPVINRIVIEGAGVRECRAFVPEIVTPWRADAVVTDRLRVALDALGGLLGVTGR